MTRASRCIALAIAAAAALLAALIDSPAPTGRAVPPGTTAALLLAFGGEP